MKTAKTFKRVGAIMLTLALLVGMMSVCGTFSFGTSAAEVTKFSANFAELNNSGQFTGTSAKYIIMYNDPATDTSATNVANHNWLSTRLDSYTNFHNTNQRGYFSQGDDDGGSRFVYGALNALGGMADAYRGLLFDNASPGGELFWSINTLVPKHNGEVLNVKNFEATVKFAMTNNLSGGLLFAFHESAAGQYTFADSYATRKSTGSVLAIGNSVDTKAGYGASGSSTDAWKFYADGKVEANYMTNVDKNFGVNLNSQWYTLTVKAVNGTATFTLVSEDGTVNETMSKAYTTTKGGISLGISGREMMVREINLSELDNDGNAVDLGFANACDDEYNAVEKFDAHFSDGLNANATWASTGAVNSYNSALNDPTTDTSAKNVASHNWLSERFDAYMNFHNVKQRSYFGEGDDDGGSHFVFAQRAAVHVTDADRSLMLNNTSAGGELFWSINTLVPKHDGEAINVKNFEATVKFAMTNNLSGGLLFAFHESAAGQYTMTNSNATRQSTGSVLAIGNSVDTKAGWGANGSSTDAWKFYANGSVEADYMTNVDKNFGQNLGGQWYTLTVKAVNGIATFTLVSADGTVNETMTKALSTVAGNVSLGLTGREIMVNSIKVVELDDDGMPVDIGTYVSSGDSFDIEGMPGYVGGKVTATDTRDDGKLFVIEDTTKDQYDAFVASVEAAGWTKVSDNQAANNLFATYQKDGKTVYMYYLANVDRVHVIEMPAGSVLPSAVVDYTKVCDPLFTQVQLSYATASEGMSYLLRLSDGRFIVIDGGDDEADYLESKHLYNLMKEQNVLDKITVAAWIVTHAHGDHQLVPTEFMNYYTADDLTIEQVLFNYPVTTPDAAQTNAFIAAVNAWGATGTKRVTPYIGQEFNYADAKIEFLHTVDAYAPGQIDGEDFNNTSSVFTIEIAGQKIMILGDMHTIGNDHLVKLYGNYLKSDISQWAHHGVGGATKELYVEIDPAVVMNPAGVFHHTNTYNYYRYHAPASDRTAQSFKWLYYPANDATNHVTELFTMGFKEVTLTLPYTSPEDCEYFANRNNNGYVFEEAAPSDAAVPNPFFELDLGDTTETVYYKDRAYEVPSKRVEKSATVETYTVDGLGNVLSGNNSFELFIAIDNLADVLTGETFYMFGTSTMGLTLENNTLNVSLRRGNNTAILNNGGRYYRGNVVGGKVVNHIVGTYNASTNTLSIYENGVLITTGQYAEGFTAEDVLTLGSANFNAMSGYTVLGARIYDAALTDEQVAAAYRNAVDDLSNSNRVILNTETNTITVTQKDGYELKAGSLIAQDAAGNKYVPTRVGFREGGDASQFITADAAETVSYEFIQPTLDNPNIGTIGTSFNRELHGLRFITRFTRQVIDGVEYVVMTDGSKYAISDYGMLLAAQSGLDTTAATDTEDMVVDSANAYVKQFSALQLNKYYDVCDDYIDLSACIVNMDQVADFDVIKNMKMYVRTYVVVDVDGAPRVLYGDIFNSTYYNGLAGATKTSTVAELKKEGVLLIDGRHLIADETTNKGFVDAGDIVVDFGNAGITIAGDLAGDVYVDVAYNMYAFGKCRINVMVDGTYVDDVVAVYGNNKLKVVSGLEGGYHTIKISKGVGTPTLGDLVFKSVTYNGYLEAPQVNDLQFMFLGDSITDTAGILGAYEDAPDQAGIQLPSQNIRLGYAALTSKALGADFTQVSLAGNTISQTLSLFKEESWLQQGQTMPYIYGSNDTTEKDVVVINLGTNVSADMHNDAKACLTAVRAKYPNAYIVWTYGMMFTDNDALLSAAVAEWVAETGDTKTSYCSLVAAANTDGGAQHPLAFAHKNAADILTAHIADVLGVDVQ